MPARPWTLPASSESVNFVFDPEPPVTIPVTGTSALFPVRRIWCIGRNYADHALEMGFDPESEPPFFFSKPVGTVVQDGSELPYPPATSDLHHEVELVVALRSGGSNLDAAGALDHVFGYAAGLDMTRRDLQAQAKKLGRPWDLAKGFDCSAPIGAIAPASRIGHPGSGRISLSVNDEVRQDGDLKQQLWPVANAIAYLSTLVELRAGDLIMTGTPAGVGAVNPGDRLEGRIAGVGSISVSYRP